MPSAGSSVQYVTGGWRVPANLSVLPAFDRCTAIGTIGGMIAFMKDDKGRKLLSCREAAERYGCSMRYIRKLAKDGTIYSETVAGSYMVSEDDVAKLKDRVGKAKGRHKRKAEKFKPG